MSAAKDNLLMKREVLSAAVVTIGDLLTELHQELETSKNNGVEAYVLRKFIDRVRQIELLRNTVIQYDAHVMQYLNYYPENTPVYKERLEVARLYIEAIGGDWNTVLWGKKSDY